MVNHDRSEIPFPQRLTVRVLAVGVLLMTLPSSLLFYAGYLSLEGVLRQSVREQVDRAVSTASDRLESFFDGFLRLSSRISQNEFLRKALVPAGEIIDRSLVIDRAIEAETGFFPNSEELFFTFKAPDGQLFTNWSRNLLAYQELETLPLVQKARASDGFTVWESFARPYIREEDRPGRTFISLARMIPTTEPTLSALLLMSFRTEVIRLVLDEVVPGNGAVLLLCDAEGRTFASTNDPATPASLVREAVRNHRSGDPLGPWTVVFERLRTVPGDLEGGGMLLVCLYPQDSLAVAARSLLGTFSAVFLVLMLTAGVTGYFISRRILLPVGRLAAEMRRWSLGRPLPELLLVPRNDEIGGLQQAFAAMHGKIDELFAAVQKEHQIREHYRFVSQQAQLNPHFLFNSLNTLRFMAIMNKSQNMLEAIDAVSTVLQHSLGRDTSQTTVGEEVRSLESLVKVYNLRFGDAFSLEVAYRGDADLSSYPILRFLLYPAVENALLHGYSERKGTGRVRISVGVEDNELWLTVEDWGVGIPHQKLAELFEETHREQGIGLYNIREMIRQVYGPQARFWIESRPGEGTVVNYRLPGPGRFEP